MKGGDISPPQVLPSCAKSFDKIRERVYIVHFVETKRDKTSWFANILVCSFTIPQDFFVGGAHRLHDPRYASKPGSFRGTFLSRFGFRTETSGTLRVRLHLAEQVRVGRCCRGRGIVPNPSATCAVVSQGSLVLAGFMVRMNHPRGTLLLRSDPV